MPSNVLNPRDMEFDTSLLVLRANSKGVPSVLLTLFLRNVTGTPPVSETLAALFA